MRAEKDMWRETDKFWDNFMNRLWIAASRGVPLNTIEGTLSEHFENTDRVLTELINDNFQRLRKLRRQ